MATKSDDARKAEKLREVIQLLSLAMAQCEKALEEAEEAVRRSGQDNAASNSN